MIRTRPMSCSSSFLLYSCIAPEARAASTAADGTVTAARSLQLSGLEVALKILDDGWGQKTDQEEEKVVAEIDA